MNKDIQKCRHPELGTSQRSQLAAMQDAFPLMSSFQQFQVTRRSRMEPGVKCNGWGGRFAMFQIPG